jgi:hypothetical protein
MSRERELWALLEHPNILPFYGYAEDEQVFGLFGALISPVRWQIFISVIPIIRRYHPTL